MKSEFSNGIQLLIESINSIEAKCLTPELLTSLRFMQTSPAFKVVLEIINSKLGEYAEFIDNIIVHDQAFEIYDQHSMKRIIHYATKDLESFLIKASDPSIEAELISALYSIPKIANTANAKRNKKYSPGQVIPISEFDQGEILNIKKAIYYHNKGALDPSWILGIIDFSTEEFVKNLDEIIVRNETLKNKKTPVEKKPKPKKT